MIFKNFENYLIILPWNYFWNDFAISTQNAKFSRFFVKRGQHFRNFSHSALLMHYARTY